MSYRMACDYSDKVASIINMVGSMLATSVLPRLPCRPTTAVSVLHIHATKDEEIKYQGGTEYSGVGYASAEECVSRWATYN